MCYDRSEKNGNTTVSGYVDEVIAMEKDFDIIGLENGIVDLALQVDELPERGSAATLWNYLWQPGGNVDNAIAAAARQGSRCSFMGTVGNDVQGDFFRKDLIYHGIDTSHLLSKDGTTTIAVCLAEKKSQERSFLVYRGDEGSPDLKQEDLDERFIAGSKYLHVGAASGKMMRIVVDMARKNGVIISVDGASLSEDLEWTLDHCDIMIMSKQFYRQLFGESSEDYVANMKRLSKEREIDTCIVTLGSDGCAGANRKGESFRIPAFSGFEIIDTTGAGDVFHGGFLFAHSQGWDLERCARYASAVSFIKCTTLGGRVGIPDRRTVEQFLENGTIDLSGAEERRKHYSSVMSLD